MPLIAVTHLPIVITNGIVVGSFAILVAAVTCLPLGYLWEKGGQTIWAAAMVHAANDAFKLFETPAGNAGLTFSVSLALVSLLVPLAAFAFGDRLFATPAAADRSPGRPSPFATNVSEAHPS